MGSAGATGQVGGLAAKPRDGVGYSGVMGAPGVPSSLYGQPGELAVGRQVGGLAVVLGAGVGYGGVVGGAGALGAPHGQPVRFAIGLGRGFGWELRAGSEPSARHRSHSVEQPTTGRRKGVRPGPPWRRRRRQPLDHARQADQQGATLRPGRSRWSAGAVRHLCRRWPCKGTWGIRLTSRRAYTPCSEVRTA